MCVHAKRSAPLRAVVDAGATRLRPVLMTAMAMIIGMVPMALGLGEAGEQNAPLGRAVIGGLIVATIATLFVVPVFYTLLAASRRGCTASTHVSQPRRQGHKGRGMLVMARRGRFGSFLFYLVGLLMVAGAAFGGLRLWQLKDAQLIASREALAEGVAKGPAVQVGTIMQGPKERLITLLGDTRPYQTATLYAR